MEDVVVGRVADQRVDDYGFGNRGEIAHLYGLRAGLKEQVPAMLHSYLRLWIPLCDRSHHGWALRNAVHRVRPA